MDRNDATGDTAGHAPERTPRERERRPSATGIETTGPSFTRRVLIALGLASLFLVLGLLFFNALQIFLLIFAGILFAIFLASPANWLARHTPIPRGVALTLVIVLLVGLIAGGIWLLGPRLSSQAQQLATQLPDSLQEVREVVRSLPGGGWILDNVGGGGAANGLAGSNIVSRVTGTASLLWDVVAKLLFVLFLGVFLASAPHTYRDGTVRLFPRRIRTRAREVLASLGNTLQYWLMGQLISMMIIGVLVTVGLMVIGMPLALALGILAGLLEFVPIVGPFVAFIPAALIALSQGTTTLLWVVVLYVVVQQLEGNVILPLVQRQTVDLPAALTVSAVFIAGAAFGPVGILVATPLMAAVWALVHAVYLEDALDDEGEQATG